MAKVLIVDDSKMFSRVIKDIVSSAHDNVIVANSGLEALEKYRSTSPDIVLLDVTMPNMDGRECLERIVHLNSNAKIIMISAIQTDDIEQQCFALGAKSFINKKELKFDDLKCAEQLLAVIDSVLNGFEPRKIV